MIDLDLRDILAVLGLALLAVGCWLVRPGAVRCLAEKVFQVFA